MIFSSSDPQTKLDILASIYEGPWYVNLLHLAVIPAASAFLALLMYPLPARWVYRFVRAQQIKLKAARLELDNETPASQSEYNEIRKRLFEMQSEYENQLLERDAEIAKLRQGSPKKTAKADLTGSAPSRSGASGSLSLLPADSPRELPEGIAPLTIEAVRIGERTYRNGVDFSEAAPGKVNLLRDTQEFEIDTGFEVELELSRPLEANQFIRVFNGHEQTKYDELLFIIHKIDFEKKNARVEVRQPNPLAPGRDLVVSNMIQFAF